MLRFLSALLAVTLGLCLYAREPDNPAPAMVGARVYPQESNGLPIKSVTILIEKEGRIMVADSVGSSRFYNTLNIYPGGVFNLNIANMAMKRLDMEPGIKEASYRLYAATQGAPLDMVVSVSLLPPDTHKSINGREGMVVTRSPRDFPLIFENDKSEVTLIMNGAVGLFDDKNGFFGHGKVLNEGNPIATDPEGMGTRFWGEVFVEPGLAGIVELGRSRI